MTLLVSAIKFIGGLSSLWFLHSRLDRVGSRLLMFVSIEFDRHPADVDKHGRREGGGEFSVGVGVYPCPAFPFAPFTCA